MAAGKKKKKPVSNPARGFATTSTVSKSKHQDSEEIVLEPQSTELNIEDVKITKDTTEASSVLEAQRPTAEKALHELSPEELESQLETSELQALIDEYREGVKKNVQRQVSRLKTERRLLRSQAITLNTSQWLSQETVRTILDQADVSKFTGQVAHSRSPNATLPDAKLLISMWTLHQILPLIGFSNVQREDALRSLVERTQRNQDFEQGSSKDSIWGLDYCLDWLALATSRDESPRYDDSADEQRSTQRAVTDAKVVDTSSYDTTETASNPSIETIHPKVEPNMPVLEEDPVEDLSPDSSSDSDIEQAQLILKYLSLQTRRFHLDPQSLGKRPKDTKRHGQPRAERILDSRLARIDKKLAKMKSDILFDIDEAESQWAGIRLDLIQEAAHRRKLDITEDGTLHRLETTDAQSPCNDQSSTTKTEPDEEVLLGDLFLSLPEISAPQDGGSGRLQVASETTISMVVRDFGKWGGLHPRRILEETCKARDSSCKIHFGLLSHSSFSKRHYVQVMWSRTQVEPRIMGIEGVSYNSDDRSFCARMEAIACPDAGQSEAYISTLALYLVFAFSPEREKVRVRLPPVWRDLWHELLDLSNKQSDEEDRSILRELRTLIQEVRLEDSTDSQGGSRPSQERSDYKNAHDDCHSKPGPLITDDQSSLKALWSTKAASASYQAMLHIRKGLPIYNFKQQLLACIYDHPIVIICGETGCGKSTQVPSYILEEEVSNGRSCKIYCTEPRRISAISLARRVSEELGERRGDVGSSRSLVGYAIRLESAMTAQTRLVYATTGIVMRMLESQGGLDEVTHLVLDEVHERSIESDFLLIVLRKLMIKRPNLKVVLMSATVDAQRFSTYLDNAPIMTVPGRTFPVETKFLEDAIEVTKFRSGGASVIDDYDEDNERDSSTFPGSQAHSKSDQIYMNYSARTRESLANFDEYRISYDLIVALLSIIATSRDFVDYSKAILVFLPGIAEIRRLNDMLVGSRIFGHGWNVYPLHSSIATEEQEHAFLVPPLGVRKIVIATNIAETGITIPDVTCVIDAGKHKEIRFDERRQLSKLIESFISRANAKQRRGRAGRVQKGLCFHLFTKHRHDSMMAGEQTPEMLRLSLQDLVLRVKICKLGGIEQTLSEALDPPSAKNVRRAIDALIDVKALTGVEELTALGRQLARLPLDVFLGKLILLGSMFGCLSAMLSIAAILSSKSPFSAPMQARSQADLARLSFKIGDSDLLTVYNAYCAWQRVCSSSSASEAQFCRKNFLNQQTLSNIEELKGQLLVSLVDAGFVTLSPEDKAALGRVRSWSRHRNFVPNPPQHNSNNQNHLVLNSVIAWSFYPKLLRRDGKGWRNVANNQSVSLHPTSVNKGGNRAPEWLSFYHIMQSSNKFYNAHETSAVEDFAIALLCGEADFRMFSGVIIVDGNRIRFSLDDWKKMIALRTLRTQLRSVMSQRFRYPDQPLSAQQQEWLNIWQKMITREERRATNIIA